MNSQLTGRQDPAKKMARPVAIISGLLVVGVSAMVAVHFLRSSPAKTAAAKADSTVRPEEPIEANESSAAKNIPAAQQATIALNRPIPVHRAPRTEPSPSNRQLVNNLTEINFGAPLTAEQTEQWQQGLKQLIAQGNAAVPAIREFLERNREWNFGSENNLGHPSLRAAFFDALQQIGDADARELLLQTLQTTSVPREIAQLARYFEQKFPGQYRGEINQAAREVLAQAGTGDLSGWDIGPVFQILQDYGDSTVIAELEKSAAKWNYYSALTLAEVSSGEGVPSLIRLAKEASPSSSRNAAVEVLGQIAFQSPEATAVLVDYLRTSKISDRTWNIIAGALAGERHFISDTGGNNINVPIGSGARNYHLQSTSQNFYVAPEPGGMSGEQVSKRIAVIEKLLAIHPNASVTQALENARSSLLAKTDQAFNN